MANIEKEAAKRDQYLDQATAALARSKALVPAESESEVVTMEGFIHTIRLTVDPATRGPQYSGLAFQSLNKAVALNPKNPRALSLLAQMQYGTAKFFGSSTAEACETNRKALALFAEEDTTSDSIAPTWGLPVAQGMELQCGQ